MKLAICLFVYNRLDNLKKTVESLSKAELASSSHLIIYSDGYTALSKDDVLIVRKYLRTIKCFRKIEIIERNTNLGLMKSILAGVTETLSRHDAIIVLEDDLEVSKDFLSFMNDALVFYAPENSVKSVSGYSIGIKEEASSYFLHRPHSWGWGTWRDRWNEFIELNPEIQSIIKNKTLDKKSLTTNMGQDVIRMIRQLRDGRISSWYTLWIIYHHLTNGLSLYPTSSKILNLGYGGQGTHCEGINPFPSYNYRASSKPLSLSVEPLVNERTLKKVNYFYSNRYKLIFRIQQLTSHQGRNFLYRDIMKRIINILQS